MEVAPFGSWASPITAEMLTAAAVSLGGVRATGGVVYWLEGRPTEGGRQALVRRDPDGTIADVLPPPWNVRTLVHEYGGGSYAAHGRTVYFVEFEDQRLYRAGAGGQPEPLTPASDPPRSVRYADLDLAADGTTAFGVRERHLPDGPVVNDLVRFDLIGGGAPVPVMGGHDFFAAPRLSPDGSELAWLSWDHPRMPWDGSELWVAPVAADGTLGAATHLAGGPAESVSQPRWAPDGTLHFVSDRTGWWNLYRAGPDGAEPVAPVAAEFGLPQWSFGMQRYVFRSDGGIIAAVQRDGLDRLGVAAGGRWAELETGLTFLSYALDFAGGLVWCAAGGPDLPASIVTIDPESGEHAVIRPGAEVAVDLSYFSQPEPITFPTTGGEAHAVFYPPVNPVYQAPAGELPPLLVLSHGGPTAATTAELDLGLQYWTTRGLAVVDVNYGGSTGYGREYRERLRGRWGVVDIDDCVAAARFLAAAGRVDGSRLVIRGGSAGGYTTLGALAFRDAFAAGASYFGVADLEALAAHTHKFESRYLDGLIGPLPEAAELYRARSPLHHIDGLSRPVILLQGLEDAVVPPEQAELMVAALDAKGIPHAYVAFPGEQHGFRRAENQIRARQAELYFLGRILGFEPADRLEQIPIPHLDV